jgi:hypothetical protein
VVKDPKTKADVVILGKNGDTFRFTIKFLKEGEGKFDKTAERLEKLEIQYWDEKAQDYKNYPVPNGIRLSVRCFVVWTSAYPANGGGLLL